VAKSNLTIDDYLADVPEDERAALEKLRKAIKAAAPEATETISYQIPTFKHQGRLLVGFGATKNHCTFYLMSTSVMDAHKDDLKDYEVGKGSIRFPANKPLPADLVRKLVKARVTENTMPKSYGRKRGQV